MNKIYIYYKSMKRITHKDLLIIIFLYLYLCKNIFLLCIHNNIFYGCAVFNPSNCIHNIHRPVVRSNIQTSYYKCIYIFSKYDLLSTFVVSLRLRYQSTFYSISVFLSHGFSSLSLIPSLDYIFISVVCCHFYSGLCACCPFSLQQFPELFIELLLSGLYVTLLCRQGFPTSLKYGVSVPVL